MIEKKVINYYLSFYDVSKDLSEKQFYQFNMAIFKVMFFEEHIDNITFEDKTLSILWKSVKHSIQASVKGYCDKKNIPYDDIFNSLTKPLTNNANEKEKPYYNIMKMFYLMLIKMKIFYLMLMKMKNTNKTFLCSFKKIFIFVVYQK